MTARQDEEDGEDRRRPLVSGVILAAGASSRMGRPKQLLPLEEGTLLQAVVDNAVASLLDEIVLVLGHEAQTIRDSLTFPTGQALRVALNPDYAKGQSGSLLVGLHAAHPRAEAAAVLLGDQPGVGAELIDRVTRAFLNSTASMARPEYGAATGEPVPGHPVLMRRCIWPELEKLEGDRGARALLRRHPEWLLKISVAGDPPPDIDTWQDYQRLRASNKEVRRRWQSRSKRNSR